MYNDLQNRLFENSVGMRRFSNSKSISIGRMYFSKDVFLGFPLISGSAAILFEWGRNPPADDSVAISMKTKFPSILSIFAHSANMTSWQQPLTSNTTEQINNYETNTVSHFRPWFFIYQQKIIILALLLVIVWRERFFSILNPSLFQTWFSAELIFKYSTPLRPQEGVNVSKSKKTRNR